MWNIGKFSNVRLIDDIKNTYFCPICLKNHFLDSKIGKEHYSVYKNYREKQKKEYEKTRPSTIEIHSERIKKEKHFEEWKKYFMGDK